MHTDCNTLRFATKGYPSWQQAMAECTRLQAEHVIELERYGVRTGIMGDAVRRHHHIGP